MADITGNFNKNMPSGTSRKSDGDDLMRQHWGALGSTLTEEHHFTDSTASAGIHKKGSARAYVKSTVSAAGLDRDGKIWLDSANSHLYVLRGSSITNRVSVSPNEQAVHYSWDSRAAIAVGEQLVTFSFTTDTINSVTTFTFPKVFVDQPSVVASVYGANAVDRSFVVFKSVTSTGLSFWVRDEEAHADDVSNHTVSVFGTGFISNFS